jgi:hypothetical protein
MVDNLGQQHPEQGRQNKKNLGANSVIYFFKLMYKT